MSSVRNHPPQTPPENNSGLRPHGCTAIVLWPCADCYLDSQDTQEEECQEGNSVLFDGVRRLRNRCVGGPVQRVHTLPKPELNFFSQDEPLL